MVETSLAPGRDIVRGVAQFVRTRGPWALYHDPRSLESALPGWLHGWAGDGVIARLQNPEIAGWVQSTGVPAVDVLGVAAEGALPLVHVDDAAIARLAAGHLLERGFRRFAFVGLEGENWSPRRRDAFLREVGAAGGTCEVHEGPRETTLGRDWETVERHLTRWVSQLQKPVGIMVSTDQLGPRVLEACRRARVAVPEDVAVVGVDNDQPLCEVCDPPLSSVDANHFMVGFEAAALLDRLMSAKRRPATAGPPARHFVAPAGVVTRTSTDLLGAVDDPAVAKALSVIREHACDGVGVDAVASATGVSRSVLQRRFRAALGRSVHEVLLQTRIKRARLLLTSTDLPLAEVAERAGFRHQEYLGAVFRRELGTTPRQFRRRRTET